MWGNEDGSGDLDKYFKVIEFEAQELCHLYPQNGGQPSFNKTGAGDTYGSHQNSVYGASNGYSSNYVPSSNNYNPSNYGDGGGSSSYGNYGYGGLSSNNYGRNPPSDNYGSSSNHNYGNSGGYGNSNYSSSNRQDNPNELYNSNASNYANAYTDNGNMDWTSRHTDNAPASNVFGGPSNSNYGGGGGGSSDQTIVYYGNYRQNQDPSSAAPNYNYDDSAANQNSQHQSSYVENNCDSVKPHIDSNNCDVQDNASAPEDIDGYQLLDFNRCLISYNESTCLNIRHVFLNVLIRADLMEYISKIMECACQDKIVLAIQRDNRLVETFATQLRQKRFWAFEVTNKTAEPVKLIDQHGVYRCAVTTMSFLRDNVDLFKRPSVIINFDHVVSHVKFLERFLNYRACGNPATSDNNDVYIYHMCFNHSTTSQNLKDFIQSQSEGGNQTTPSAPQPY